MQTEQLCSFLFKGTSPILSVFFLFFFKIQFSPVITQELLKFEAPSLLSAHRLEGPLTSSDSKHLLDINCWPGSVLNAYADTHRGTTILPPEWDRNATKPACMAGANDFTLPGLSAHL